MDQTTPVKNNRAVLLLVGGIPLIIILAATWLWYFVANGELDLVGMLGTGNRGSLVKPPRQLDEQPLADATGLAVRYAELEPRWALLIPEAGASCDTACEKTLYTTRQIHVAMGKEFNRLRRLYVSESTVEATALDVATLSDERPAPATFGDYLQAEHRGLKALTLDAGGYAALFPEHMENATTWYLVDPAGWIMMSYNSDIPYKDVISDLKFLLKNSGG